MDRSYFALLFQNCRFSFNSRYLSIKVKNTEVMPVFKGGSTDQVDTYRPVSLLKSLSKFF